jgi:hypothetical protein
MDLERSNQSIIYLVNVSLPLHIDHICGNADNTGVKAVSFCSYSVAFTCAVHNSERIQIARHQMFRSMEMTIAADNVL